MEATRYILKDHPITEKTFDFRSLEILTLSNHS